MKELLIGHQMKCSRSVDVEDRVESAPVSIEEEFGNISREILVTILHDFFTRLGSEK